MERLEKAKKLMAELKKLQRRGKEETEEFYNLDEQLHDLLNQIQSEL